MHKVIIHLKPTESKILKNRMIYKKKSYKLI